MGGGTHAWQGHAWQGGAFRGAQASMGGSQVAAVRSGSFAGRGGAQLAQGGYQGGYRGDRGGWRGEHRGYGRGIGFGAGLAAGAALGYGYGAYADPYYYGDDYAYDDSYDGGYPAYSSTYTVAGGSDPAYCAQRYRSYDPASGTYLGFDGLRHLCGE
jgi:hypothetical protein